MVCCCAIMFIVFVGIAACVGVCGRVSAGRVGAWHASLIIIVR